MKEKTGLIIGVMIIITVLLAFVLWMINIGTIEVTEIGSFAVIILLVTAAAYVLWDRAKNIRKGLPSKDERLISISHKAGYYGFITAIWSAVFGPLIIDIIFRYELEASRVSALVVITSGIVFMVSYLYLSWKGK